MLFSTPRLVIAGLAGDSGKTMVSLGVVRALARRRLRVAPFKKGPDYIDAAWLSAAAGAPGRNLDTYMMSPQAIVYPAIAMFGLTLCVLVSLGIARYRAVRGREVSVRFFAGYNEGEQPQRLHIMSRHLQNHFEVPPIFYAAVLFMLFNEIDQHRQRGLVQHLVALQAEHPVAATQVQPDVGLLG